jgi:DNA-directed RNA polymerase II subunit RPB2
MELTEDVIWKLIDIYFRDNPQGLVRHHIESYNDFLDYDLSQLFKETNPLKLDLEYDSKQNQFKSSAKLFFGGKEGNKIHFGKPIIYDSKENVHLMFPNEARLRNMTYAIPIYCDIDIYITRILDVNNGDKPTDVDDHTYKMYVSEEDKTPSMIQRLNANINSTMITPTRQEFQLKSIRKFICYLPIMVQSKKCILNGIPRDARFALGECKNDFGGYFIIDGKEKTVVCQEKFGDNMLYVRKMDNDDHYLFSADIRSVSENVSKPIRTLSVRLVAPTKKYTNHNIVVHIPNVKKPVPLFILFRALGILSDREIISMCILKDPSDSNDEMRNITDWFLPSIHDASNIYTQQDALNYLSLFIKGKTITRVLYILADFFLPHVGEINFTEKAYYLGYMVQRLWAVSNGLEPTTDRDNYKFKRVELIGSLLKDLFREYYLQYQSAIRTKFETRYEFNKEIFKDISTLIEKTQEEVFEDNVVNEGIQKAFKGNWGATPRTKRIGVVQDLNRLSNNGMISHLRKTNLPLDASVKLVGPRILHSSQWGIIDPIDTPDGGNIGIHKYLSILTYITRNHSREPIIQWMRNKINLIELTESYPVQLGKWTKVFVNGHWCGVLQNPLEAVIEMRESRRHSLLPISTSIAFDIARNSVFIYTDGGRLCRPILYRDEITKKFPFQTTEWKTFTNHLLKDEYSWIQCISGFLEKKDPLFDPTKEKIYEWEELYSYPIDKKREKKALLDYIDTNESESALIAIDSTELRENTSNKMYTHHEIHESTLYGTMCNQINYLEHNPVTRNSFSCGQSKQACSLYHTNYILRMDKTAVVLNNGQIPLVKSRYLKYINNEENPYGVNVIVAIMCFTGYNVEDAILINQGALDRGLFRTTYYSTYEAHEEKEQKGDSTYIQSFSNIESLIQENRIMGTTPGYDYSKLDSNGLILENTEIDDKTIVIGMTSSVSGNSNRKDTSKKTKKGQLGIVDKSFMTEGEEGQRIAKVRLREERIPAIGDKMASRAGQKGTIGMVIPEVDMPYTKDGIRPDIIINPHALPSRMTIGQIVECITSKTCAFFGAFGDCTPFINKGMNSIGFFGELLQKLGYHSSGNEILYDGMSGEQLESEIFIGPTYYMRLKHMVKDKINFRARGPMTNLTRQPVSGRANDGGLRIGEMERDAVLAHGTASFLNESMMERGDKYSMAICNKTGMVAVYNPSKNILFSPMADGPIQYTGSLSDHTTQIHQLSKYGRDFSIVEVPYSFKLLLQELQSINIRMCIITEDNISQIEKMVFSHNLDQLMSQKGILPQNIIDTTKQVLEQSISNHKMKEESKRFSRHTPDEPLPNSRHTPDEPPPNKGFPKYIPHTPDYTPPTSLENSKNVSPGVNTSPIEIPLDNIPPSPDSTPPGLKLKRGSSIPSTTTEMKGGDQVHYRGDIHPERIWIISQIGEKFCTIDTNDYRDLSTEQSIKVVQPNEIYPLEDYIYSVPIATPYDEATFQPSHPSQEPNHYPSDSKIHFAPVIKIFNEGNDMSTGNTTDANTALSSSYPIPNINHNPNIKSTSIEQNEPVSEVNFNTPLMIVKKL